MNYLKKYLFEKVAIFQIKKFNSKLKSKKLTIIYHRSKII